MEIFNATSEEYDKEYIEVSEEEFAKHVDEMF